MRVARATFEGHDCVRLESGSATVYVTTSVGPRVLGLVGPDGQNVLAILPDAALEMPGGGRFRLLGGHRLWAAPEVPEVTYQPDERPCQVHELEGGVRVDAPADGAGLVKSIEIRPEGGGFVLHHALRNASDATMTVAPWAITQVRLGGEVAFPLGGEREGLQASSSLVLWPYTDLADPRIRSSGGEVFVDARPAGPRFKVGAAPGTGHVRYRLGGSVFEKRADVDAGASYADRGAGVQVYLCDEFCEMETLGPLRALPPGEVATHRERWTLRPAAEAPTTGRP
ncbi:MAG: hypothetical protein ACXWX9_05150 [Actinomycetota bacterium]